MCVIIYKPKDIVLSETTLKNCYDKNPDGCGMAYVNSKNNIMIEKGLYKFEEFMEKFNSIITEESNPNLIIHFRIKTHGNIDYDNCHPFKISDDIVFAHNGTILGYTPDKKSEVSDTILFNVKVLQFFHSIFGVNFLDKEEVKEIVINLINGSRLVFLNNKNEVTILNESKGEWKDKCWFSNILWIPAKKTYTYTYHNYGQQNINLYKYNNQNKNTYCCLVCRKILNGDEAIYGICNDCIEKYYKDPFKDEITEKYLKFCVVCGELVQNPKANICERCGGDINEY
jgi:predicted glutamine amidotransferase